jgi:cobyrinic acid a,c-diamide synthase
MLVAAPASGQGKTTVSAALCRMHALSGLKVRAFKCGPDFLDPMILGRATGHPAYQLDLWMCGEGGCRELLWQAAGEADLILVEGVMGLYDGRPSAADLAALMGLPVLAVISAQAMAQTFAAVAHGLRSFRPGLPWAGVLANNVAGDSHARILRDSLPPDMPWMGSLSREERIGLPSRHLGLVQASELSDLDLRLDRAAQALSGQGAAVLPAPALFHPPEEAAEDLSSALSGLNLAVARDRAFGFIYPANLDLLASMGARINFFSPVAGEDLPPGTDGLYLPGGYPELFLPELAQNRRLMDSVRRLVDSGRPCLAECGGLLYLLEYLEAGGERARMAGALPGRAVLSGGLRGLGLMWAELPEGALRGHSFHHSLLEMDLPPLCLAQRQDSHRQEREAVWRLKRLTASYLHFYFPSNPAAAARLFAPG